RVYVLDDLSTGKLSNLPEQCELLLGDVLNVAGLARGLPKLDAVFHLAAVASVDECRRHWLATHQVNASAFIGLLEWLKSRGETAVPVVYASSAAVYGEFSTPKAACETDPAHPISPYGADKLACELHGRIAAELYGMQAVGLRFFNVYGPRQDPASPYSGVISIFSRQALLGETLTIYGDGKQTRDFVHVRDVTRACLAARDRAAKLKGQAINVCTGRASDLHALVEAIEKSTGRSLAVRHADPRPGDIRFSLGDPTRMRKLLGIEASVGLSDGIAALMTDARNDLTGTANLERPLEHVVL